jgi:hypothetical protein
MVAVKDPSEIEGAIATLGTDRTSALIVMPDSFNVVHRIESLPPRRAMPSQPSIRTATWQRRVD